MEKHSVAAAVGDLAGGKWAALTVASVLASEPVAFANAVGVAAAEYSSEAVGLVVVHDGAQ